MQAGTDLAKICLADGDRHRLLKAGGRSTRFSRGLLRTVDIHRAISRDKTSQIKLHEVD